MRKTKWIIWTLIIILLTAFFLFLSWISATQRDTTLYDPESYSPYGFKALGLFLQKAGLEVRKTEKMSLEQGRLLIISNAALLSQEEQRRILAWVKSGGQVLELAYSAPVIWPSRPGSDLKHLNRHLKTLRANPGIVKGPGGLRYHCHNDWVHTVKKPDNGYLKIKDQYFVYGLKFGSGIIIHWNDPDGLLNINLKQHPDNAVIMVLILRSVPCFERVDFFMPLSGFRADTPDRIKLNLSHYWVAGLLLLSGLGIMLWKISARFGRPQPLTLAKGRSADEFINSMARLFRQAGAKDFVLNNLVRSLLEIMSDITGLPWDTDLKVLTERLAANGYHETSARKISELVEAVKQNPQRRLAGRAFLHLTTELDALRKELEQWKKSSRWSMK